jgi:hypothetical protein
MKIASRDTGPPPISRELSAAEEIALLGKLFAERGDPLVARLSRHARVPDTRVWTWVKVRGPNVGIVDPVRAPNHDATLRAEWRLTNCDRERPQAWPFRIHGGRFYVDTPLPARVVQLSCFWDGVVERLRGALS